MKTVRTIMALAALVALMMPASAGEPAKEIPKLLDLGSTSCIPCKKMAPILDELKAELAGRLEVEFVDVWIKENMPVAKKHGITLIPTQIFFGKDRKELWRHEGFLSKEDILAKWKELGYDFGAPAKPAIERWEPAQADPRAKDEICYMCDGDIPGKTATEVKTGKGPVRLCGLHCTFILYSCLTEDRAGFEKKINVADWTSGKMVPAPDATYVLGLDERSGRPFVRVFADRGAALAETKAAGGSMVGWSVLEASELSHRCGFCDRACYPQDAAAVVAGGVHTWGCCAHCAMGVAARTGKDIEVRQPDGLTGEPIVVKTLGGSVASIDPPTAVAWFGKRKNAEGKWVSAGCFHQGFFRTAENLRAWLEKHPRETGEMITIGQSLADKMKLTPEQIGKACKIGECAPK